MHYSGPSRFKLRRRNSSGSRRFHSEKRVDVSKFINKAIPLENVEEFIPQHASFRDFPLNEILQANIIRKGYTQPTPIQDKTIPLLIQGRDVVGIANTGTGKTAAFLLPLINKIIANRREKVLILAPTRELALQIQEEFVIFSAGMNIRSVLCVGGVAGGPQIQGLRRGYHFVVATPGRLKDFVKRRLINLRDFRHLVLDEADRMVDMGFIHDVTFLIGQMPKERHSLFFSATIPPVVNKLIQQFLRDPVTISVKVRDTASNVDQDVIRMNSGDVKIEVLRKLLCKVEFSKVLIFGRTKHGVEKLSVALGQKGLKVAAIHGNKSQAHRQKALQLFKKNLVQVLVATDVAARGLDISDVSHVINYDLPATYEDYIHRIGRTGRADKRGKALTFIG